MSGLARQVVPVLLKGLDQLSPRQTGVSGELDSLLNMYARQGDQGGYEFVPRPGTTVIPTTSDAFFNAGTALATLNDQLLLLNGGGLNAGLLLRKATDEWHSVSGSTVAKSTRTSVATEAMGSIAASATGSDSAAVNGWTITAGKRVSAYGGSHRSSQGPERRHRIYPGLRDRLPDPAAHRGRGNGRRRVLGRVHDEHDFVREV
jgi:hypothetical protein